MVVEAAPAAALVVPEPQFLLELLVVALDAPPELGKFNQARETNVLRQGREPVFGGLLLAFRPLDQEPFLRARFAQPVIAMSGSHPHPCEARGEPIGDALAPTDLGPRRRPKSQRQAPSPRLAGARHPGASAWVVVPGPTRAWAAAVRSPAPKPRCLTGSPPCS